MQPELAVIAAQWRTIMPLTRTRGYMKLPADLHPRLVDDVYPLTVADVYTRTYKALIHPDVPAKLKHDLLIMLGHGPDIRYLRLLLPKYTWTTTDYRRCLAWDKIPLHRSTNIAYSTKSSAYHDLITISVFLSNHSRDLELSPTDLTEALGILARKADLPQLCADLVTAAAPYMKPKQKLPTNRSGI